MNDKKRIAISLPISLIRVAKILAAKKGTTVSQLIEIYLEEENKKSNS